MALTLNSVSVLVCSPPTHSSMFIETLKSLVRDYFIFFPTCAEYCWLLSRHKCIISSLYRKPEFASSECNCGHGSEFKLSFLAHLHFLSCMFRHQTPTSFYFFPILTTLQIVFFQVTALNVLIPFNFYLTKGMLKGMINKRIGATTQ